MELGKYEGKYVRIISNEGNLWEGEVLDYVWPEDNENNLESIIISCDKGKFPGKLIEFYEKDIKSIEIIK